MSIGVDVHAGSNGADSAYTVEQGSPEPILDSYGNHVSVEPSNTYSTQGSHFISSHESGSSGNYGLDTYGRRKDERNIFVKTAGN